MKYLLGGTFMKYNNVEFDNYLKSYPDASGYYGRYR